MKLDLAARREELLRERTKIEEQIAALEKEHQQALTRWQGDLRVVKAVLDQVEDIVATLEPDLSGHVPTAGGPVEPIQRRPKRDLLALTLDHVQKYPGHTAWWLAAAIEDTTKIRTLSEPILNKLEHLKMSGHVRCDRREEEDTWWPESSPDIESVAEAPPVKEEA